MLVTMRRISAWHVLGRPPFAVGVEGTFDDLNKASLFMQRNKSYSTILFEPDLQESLSYLQGPLYCP